MTPFRADFDVVGVPKAQPRHQAFARVISKPGQKPKAVARVYQKNTAEWWKSQIVMAGEMWKPAHPLEGPISLRVVFWMPRPKRLLRKKDSEGAIWHTSKPDRDNLIKPVMDALKHDGWFRDDSQVCMGPVFKVYHAKGGAPGASIEIHELELSETPNLA